MKMRDFLYKEIFRRIAFRIDPEIAHNLAIFFMKILSNMTFLKSLLEPIYKVDKGFYYLGLRFRNPIGLAAGFDKNADFFDFVEALGFGFCEVGSVTLRPQKGNPKPRIFRIVKEEAIINYIGLENKGACYVARNIEKRKKKINIPLGINIAKNNDVEYEDAPSNIFECFKILKDLGDFFVFNISCPNVVGLNIEVDDYLKAVLDKILVINNKKPVFVKISPDLDDLYLKKIVSICESYNVGIVATNTTKRRDLIITRDFDHVNGGLSGRPLNSLSFEVLKKIRVFSSKLPVISCGGIFEKDDIEKRTELGVRLFELYSSLIYEGPGIIQKLVI